MNTYEKPRGRGVLWLTKYPTRIFILSDRRESKDLSSDPKGIETQLSPARAEETPARQSHR